MGDWLPQDWGVFFLSLISVIGAISAAAVTIINALRGVSTKVDALEIKVDGRLSQLLDRTASSSRAEGVVAGRGEMASVPIPPVVPPIGAGHQQEDGTMVIGLPNPVPPVLLIPVDAPPPTGDASKSGER